MDELPSVLKAFSARGEIFRHALLSGFHAVFTLLPSSRADFTVFLVELQRIHGPQHLIHIASQGKIEKNDKDGLIPCILEPDGSSKEYRKNWARLIQKIYEVDPLTCPKCSGKMKIISVIEYEEIIKKILKHLSLWDPKPRPPPKPRHAAERNENLIDESFSQLPASDNYLYVDPQYPEVYSPFFSSIYYRYLRPDHNHRGYE